MFPIPTILITKRTRSAHGFRGGVPPYPRVRAEILRLLGDSSARMVTTMIDYYGLPKNFPGKQSSSVASVDKAVARLENALQNDIRDSRFMAYFSVHEFEALLFSSPSGVAAALSDPPLEQKLSRDLARSGSPEQINDGQNTHPSKRLARYHAGYKKVVDGPTIVARIGINVIRRQCKHFNDWVGKLETC